MLVVLAIIGIVTAGVLLSINLTGRDPALGTAARRLAALMRYARSEAELQTRDYAVVFDTGGYQFAVFSVEHNQWRTVSGEQALRPRRLPSGIRLAVRVDGRAVKLEAPRKKPRGALAPQVMLYSSGDLSSFSITVYRDGHAGQGFLIKPNRDGRIVEHQLGAKHAP